MSQVKNYKRLISLSSVYLLGSLVEKGLAFFLIPLYTAFLFPEDFGVIALLTITVRLFTVALSGPLGRAMMRFYYADKTPDKKHHLVYSLLTCALAGSFVLLIIYLVLSNFLAARLLDNPELISVVYAYAVVLFFGPISKILSALVRLQEKAKCYAFVSVSKLVLRVAILLVLLVYLKWGVLALAIGEAFSSIYTALAFMTALPSLSKYKFSPQLLVEPLRFGYMQIFASYGFYLIQMGDRYVLRFFDTLGTVGLYSFGYSFAALIDFIVITPLKQALHPIILKQESDPKMLCAFLRQQATNYYVVAMFMCLGLSLFIKEVITLMVMNADFIASAAIVPIVAFSYVQHGLGNFFGWGLVMRKYGRQLSINVVLTALVNVGLNILLVPHWGIMGAASATLASYLFWNVLKLYYSAKLYSLHFQISRIMHITVLTIALYGCSLLLHGSIVFIILAKCILLVLYPLILYKGGFFTQKEKKWIQDCYTLLRKKGVYHVIERIRKTD